jgi:hypothetical protein
MLIFYHILPINASLASYRTPQQLPQRPQMLAIHGWLLGRLRHSASGTIEHPPRYFQY